MGKQRVYTTVLCGPERTHWINPLLHNALMLMHGDRRFDVIPGLIYGVRYYEAAANEAVAQAQKERADWLLLCENDNYPYHNPLDVLAKAGEKAVIGWSYATGSGGLGEYSLFPPGPRTGGDFSEVGAVSCGLLAIHRSVWQKIKLPLFRTLSEPVQMSHDIYFSKLVRENGFNIWTPKELLGHMHTVDVTAVYCARGGK